jgi:hypothetical protein
MPLDDQVSRYVQHALSYLPSPLARLVFLACLRDHYTGHYVHEGWAGVSSPEEINAILRDTHRQVFENIFALSLPDWCRELREHFRSLGEAETRAAKLWLETEPYYEMIPEGYTALPRKMFISQVRLALEVLVRAPNWDYLSAPASLPPQPPAPQRPLRWTN